MTHTELIRAELEEATNVLQQFLASETELKKIEKAANLIVKSLEDEGCVYSCGNGGSHCDAMHFAEEMTGRYREDRPPYAAVAISDASHLSCTANDYGYDRVFSRFIRGVGRKGDVLFGISTSGNSQNILTAAEIAKQKGMLVIALTGNGGGKLAELADVEIRVPHNGYADRIQEIHIKIIHILIGLIERKLGHAS